jgi:hypothetical protein
VSGKLFRDAALADGRSPNLRLGVSVLVDADRVVWIRPSDAEDEVGPDVDILDASGAPSFRGWSTATATSHCPAVRTGSITWMTRPTS